MPKSISVSYPPQLRVRTNGLAIASMISGFLFFTYLGAVLAIVFGHIARRQIAGSQGWQRGSGMALAGLVLGYAGAALLVIALIVAATGTTLGQ
ncbi:MAG: DUF4190 domain-containing protein [Acidimicrobiia bacterium]